MLVWLAKHFAPVGERLDLVVAGDSRVMLTMRIAMASLMAFLLAIGFGPRVIRWLREHCGERIDSASERLNQIQAGKEKTPTMGGVLIVGAILISVLFFGDLSSVYVLLGLAVTVGFAILGGVDDWIKLRTTRRGLTARQKFIAQIIMSVLVAAVLYWHHQDKPRGLELVWPFGNYGIKLGVLFVAWSVLVMVGSSNAVNLTDGLDGLATGCTIFAGTAFVALSYLAGHSVLAGHLSIPFIAGSGEMGVIMGAMVGAMLGFLWFNCYPAQVFMGDTGSLPLGALLALAALVTRQEVLLVIVGGVFVIETLSVILQVGCYRITGKRLILCSPLHNHFLFQGQHELKIVVRFWIGAALLAITAMTSLKIL